jgi:hypothetical protein
MEILMIHFNYLHNEAHYQFLLLVKNYLKPAQAWQIL